MLVGAYFWGVLSDSYGRRISLLGVAALTAIAAFLSSFSPNYVSLVLTRMVVGIGLGGGHVYSSWFLEFVPVHNRGIWMSIKTTGTTLGTVLEALLVWLVLPRMGWRWLLAISSVPCFAAFGLYFLTVESPRYLYANSKIADVHNILKRVAVVNKRELPPGNLISDCITELDEESNSTADDAPLLSSKKKETSVLLPGLQSLFSLLSPSTLRATLLIWVIYSANAFLYYGVVLLTSELSSGESQCATSGSHSYDETNSSLYENVFVVSLAELPGVVLAAIFVDKIGRRNSMLLMYLCSFILVLPLMFYPNEVLKVCLLFGARMFIIGGYTLAGIYCPEIYPTSIRSTGAGVATAVARISSMISPFVSVGLVSSCHQAVAVGIFEFVIIFSATCVFFFAVETKGKELNDNVSTNN
ncbi:organic cation/carnitine transporter 7-like isoform X2 [Andrographis paniculata]|nr:organic cation/carnitine transporter 7-like isoform X2 [Andrographis paniculata]